MVVIIRNDFLHQVVAVSESKEKAVEHLYNEYASERVKEHYSPAEWWALYEKNRYKFGYELYNEYTFKEVDKW